MLLYLGGLDYDRFAAVMELADVADSKSAGSDTVPVRLRPAAPKIDKYGQYLSIFIY